MILRAIKPWLAAVLLTSAVAAAGFAQDKTASTGSKIVASADSTGLWVRARDSRVSPLRRTVALRLSNASLQSTLDSIARSAGLTVAYGEDVLRSTVRVTLRVDGLSVVDALTMVLDGTGLDALVSIRGDALLVRRPIPASRLTGAIVGRVIDGKTGVGLRAVEVLLEKTRWQTTTDSVGRYRISDVDSGSYVLTVRRFGYTKQSQQVAVHEGRETTVEVTLAPVALKLDELITTATGPQRRRDLGNAITRINADSVMRTAPIRSLTDLLENRVPGLTVQHTSGAPGDPARLRLRGIGSVLRGNDPIVFIDGKRVYAAQSDARSGNLTNLGISGTASPSASGRARSELLQNGGGNSPAPSPLDQIDPNIIETVEVLKGPSAATLYGADAANGVIVITTKKGKPGPTRWNASFTHARTTTPGRWPTGYYRWGSREIDGSLDIVCLLADLTCSQDSLVEYQALNDPDMTILGQGRRTSLSLTASGGTQALTYSITGSYSDEIGLLKLPLFEVERFRTSFNREAPDWIRRPHHYDTWSVTSNVAARLGATAEVAFTSSVSRSEQQRTSLETQVASMAGTYVDKVNGIYYFPFVNGGYHLGVATAGALNSYYTQTKAATLNLKTGLNVTWRHRSWFTASGQAGLDIIPREDRLLLPTGFPTATDSGIVILGSGRSLISSFGVRGRVHKPMPWGFVFETSVGADIATTSTNDLISTGVGLLPGTSSIVGASRTEVKDALTDISSFGWYIEPRIAGRRLSLSTGVRLDGGSAYGTRITGGVGGHGRSFLKGLLSLPKLNGSWVISEEPWFPFNGLFSSLRLRAAYGQAQVQPGPTDRLRIYTGRIDGVSRLLTLDSLGNTELRPERSVDFEGGFDADLLGNRLTLELTGYRKTQIDALMSVALPNSVNGGGSTIQNVGNIRNTGLELMLGLIPVQLPTFTWSAQLQYSRNDNTLVKLGRGVLPNKPAGLVEGYPVRGRWAKPILGYADQNGNGGLECGENQVGDSLVFLGRLQPDYSTVLSSNVTLFGGAIDISASFSYESGATQIDETARNNWVLARGLVDPSSPFSEQAALLASTYREEGNGTATKTDYGLTQDVSTFRFNTMAVNYRVPNRAARFFRAQQMRIGIQGSNLGLHSTYRSKDPNVNSWSAGEGIVDTGQLPLPRTWQVAVNLEY